MQINKKLLITLVCCTFSFNDAAASTLYKNQRGSMLSLDFHSQDSTVTGTFQPEDRSCNADPNTPLPLSGFFNGNAFAFTVNFPKCYMVMALTGNMNSDHTQLYTMWLVTARAGDPRGADWKSTTVGYDQYVQLNRFSYSN